MKIPSRVRLTFYLLALAGVALFTGLLVREGVGKVFGAFVTPKWVILGIAVYHFIPILLDTIAWWVLFPRKERPPLLQLFWMRWIGESVSTLVPSAAVGGDIVRARLAAIHGVSLATAASTVIVDLTLGIFIQAGFTITGLLLLVYATGQTSFVGPTLAGIAVGVAAFIAFFFAQRRGLFGFIGRLVAKIASSGEWQALVSGGDTLDQTVKALYARTRGLIGCAVSTIVSLIVATGEVWIALWTMDLSPSFLHAFILQTLAYTIRAAAFAVPGGIGVQEGGYVFVGSLLGIPGEAGFALSLIARMRELGVGVPGLVLWQIVESRRLLRSRTAVAPS
ncbi:MAG TPA: flippase-like domain-containing protein [Chthoniobacterales bacterium]|jgi:putative membrane protein|nr:flippase-like domain-containing protein [Chthoniobacterales bacterium]